MRVGWLGLGKLGLPTALVLNVDGGHQVTAYDVDETPYRYLRERRYTHVEHGLGELLGAHTVTLVDTTHDVVAASDVVFIAVPTPHVAPTPYGTPTLGDEPGEPADYDYTYLC